MSVCFFEGLRDRPTSSVLGESALNSENIDEDGQIVHGFSEIFTQERGARSFRLQRGFLDFRNRRELRTIRLDHVPRVTEVLIVLMLADLFALRGGGGGLSPFSFRRASGHRYFI